MGDYELLKSLGKRKIDRVLMVTDDIFGCQARMEKVFGYSSGEVFRETEETMPDYLVAGDERAFANLCSVIPLAKDRELMIVQPVEGRSPYRLYLEQYGPGVMGLRELVEAQDWEKWLEHIRREKIPVLARRGDYGLSLDLREPLGCIFELLKEGHGEEKAGAERCIGQLCIVSDDIHKTAEDMCRLLGVGPWEIGHINNRTSPSLHSTSFPSGSFPKADFLAGIAFWGDMEFELIQPLEGPLPYFDFLRRHGTGFHHIKEILSPEIWEDTLEAYRAKGIGVALGGKVGPCSWSNLAAEHLLGSIYELGDGVEMTAFPEGYDPYKYPQM